MNAAIMRAWMLIQMVNFRVGYLAALVLGAAMGFSGCSKAPTDGAVDTASAVGLKSVEPLRAEGRLCTSGANGSVPGGQSRVRNLQNARARSGQWFARRSYDTTGLCPDAARCVQSRLLQVVIVRSTERLDAYKALGEANPVSPFVLISTSYGARCDGYLRVWHDLHGGSRMTILLRDIWPVTSPESYKCHFARWNGDEQPLNGVATYPVASKSGSSSD